MEKITSTPQAVIVLLLGTLVTLSGCATKAPQVKDVLEKPAELAAVVEKIKMQPVLKNEEVNDAFELSSLADRAYRMENWSVAEKYYRRLVNQVPQDAYGYFRLGNVLMQLTKVESAVNAYNKSLKRDPNNVRALKNRSIAFLLAAELHLEKTVQVLQRQSDTSASGYQIALRKLQRLNNLPLNESTSPVQGLFIDYSGPIEEVSDQWVAPSRRALNAKADVLLEEVGG